MDSIGSAAAGDPRSQIAYAVLDKAFDVARDQGRAINELIEGASKIDPARPGAVQAAPADPNIGRIIDASG